MRALQPGDPEKIDKYQLIGVLGQGGMGRVYLGRSPDNVIVAVKVMLPDFANHPQIRERFRREMQAAEVLGSGYTASLVGCDPNAKPPWLATKFIVGGSLEAIVNAGPLDLGAVWWLAFGLVKALTEIHACKIVHRDLKPQNVIMASDGPKVIDFGIALHGGAATRLTTFGMRVGTRGFMSPEQLAGDHEIGYPSDIFSLGVVLVHAATGQLPDRDALGRALWTGPVLPSLPAELQPLVQRCLRSDPANRADLDELLSMVLAAKRDRYQQAEPSFWPQPTADRIEVTADGIRGGLPPTVIKSLPDTKLITMPVPEPVNRTGPSLASPDRVLYPAYRPALSVTSVLDRRPGQMRDATEWAIEGDRHLKDGRYDEAEKAYRASLELDPDNEVVLVDLGRTLCPRGRMREAERAFTKALDVNPRLIAARRNLYLAVYHMGGSMPTARRFGEELREACLAVLAVSADSVEGFANLGDAHYTLGQREAGAAAYEAALQLDSKNPRLQEKYDCAALGRR